MNSVTLVALFFFIWIIIFWVIKMDLNWKLNKTEHIVQDEWIDFRKESFILPDGKEFSPFYNYSRRNFVVIIARTKMISI